MRPINQAGLDLIKHFEGCRLESYQDVVGIWTLGYGHTGEGVTPTSKITQEQADSILNRDLERFQIGVEMACPVVLTDNQFSALVCFAFNVGIANLASSTLLKRILSGNFQEAADQFLRWNKAGGKQVDGLTRRREAERALFLRQ